MGLIAFIGLSIVVMIGSSFLMDYSAGHAPPPRPEISIHAIIQRCFFHRRCLEIFLALHLMDYALSIFTALETGDWSPLKPIPFRHMVSSVMAQFLIFWIGAALAVIFEYHGWTGSHLFGRFADPVLARLKETQTGT
ncbi:hypothetical protein BHE90_001558 [Fusarium euwallaceae]|uniref:Uncharacterized protein n=1 Tax=Fusarium euwallaceae TaxID=1147111 RepID=A0A430M7G4_9HYPO|nr:hypothetical protein BHE90_001558 [Fusarium euwallaceae]